MKNKYYTWRKNHIIYYGRMTTCFRGGRRAAENPLGATGCRWVNRQRQLEFEFKIQNVPKRSVETPVFGIFRRRWPRRVVVFGIEPVGVFQTLQASTAPAQRDFRLRDGLKYNSFALLSRAPRRIYTGRKVSGHLCRRLHRVQRSRSACFRVRNKLFREENVFRVDVVVYPYRKSKYLSAVV